MTSELNDIVAQVKLATDYQTNKRILREKIITQLHMPFNSGLFKISPEILAFVSTWPTDTLYLEDVYQNPIEIDKQVFLVKAQQHYFSVMNDWHEQHEQIKRIRKI
jgi:hypothetical protein